MKTFNETQIFDDISLVIDDFNWGNIRDIYNTEQIKTTYDIRFNEYATPIIREKFNLPRFDFSFAHLASKEVKDFIKELRVNF